MKNHQYLAFDLGAGSGRAMLGLLEDHRLSLSEVHRFPNIPIEKGNGIYWDVEGLFNSIKEGLRKGLNLEAAPESIGIDSWGVDYGLLGKDGNLLKQPHCYRDLRTSKSFAELTRGDLGEKIYHRTGIQLQPFNTLYQLHAEKLARPDIFAEVSKLLFIPDLFNYFLTGETSTEFTYALTSQLYDPMGRQWDSSLFASIGVPIGIMQPVIPASTAIGRLKPDLLPGCPALPVIAVGSHDTASAVAAVPARGDQWAYISSGTWSLMGIECDRPIISKRTFTLNFTNEGGVNGKFRFLKNITGMWILSECRRVWAKSRDFTFSELAAMVPDAEPFVSLIDPDWPGFYSPAGMPEAIAEYCRRTNQKSPQSQAEFVRCIFESLALKYRVVLEQLMEFSGKPIEVIHIVGGGAQNGIMCQFAANATGRKVAAGPIEATAAGNILAQAMASGQIESAQSAREIVRRSFAMKMYAPEDTALWEQALERYRNILGGRK